METDETKDCEISLQYVLDDLEKAILEIKKYIYDVLYRVERKKDLTARL